MAPDIAKSLDVLKNGLSAIGIQIQDKFIPVAISMILIFFAGRYGLEQIDALKSSISDNKIAISNEVAAREKLVSDFGLEDLSSISTLVQQNRETIDSISTQINAKFDGFWIPIAINFDDRHQRMSFRLPIQENDNVRMSVYSDGNFQSILEKYLNFRVNKLEVEKVSQFFVTEPVLIDRAFFRGERNYQEFDIGLNDDLSDADFEAIKRQQISVLIVLKRPIVVPRRSENVPD